MRESSCNRYMQVHSRRDFLAKAGFGFGSLALGYLLGQEPAYASTDLAVASNPLAPKPPHFPQKAKSVIFIFLQGGLSQVDAFDPKPTLLEDEFFIMRRLAGQGRWFPEVTGTGHRPGYHWLSYRFEPGTPLDVWLADPARRVHCLRIDLG